MAVWGKIVVGVRSMTKNRQPTKDYPQWQELSPEQREHLKENRLREERPIDHRKTDGPNSPAT